MYIAFIFPPLICSLLVLILFLFIKSHRVVLNTSLGLAILSLFFSLVYFASNQFTGEGITDSVVFHLLSVIDLAVLRQFWFELMVFSFASVVILFVGYACVRFKPSLTTTDVFGPYARMVSLLTSSVMLILAFFSVTAHPALSDVTRLLSKMTTSDDLVAFEEFFHPQVIDFSETDQSFIYIYVESLEKTFLDDTRYPGLAPRLNTLIDEQGFQISGIKQVSMTGWTIAGMTASQCGVPLSTFQARNEFGLVDSFMPGLDCWGDALSQAGYDLHYTGGADLNFAEKGLFYQTHGFNTISGLHEVQALTEDELPVSKWGLYDDALFEFSKQRLDKLIDRDEKFGYVTLTLDTHAPWGFPSPSCKEVYENGESKILNSVHCADRIVSDFVSSILDDPRFDDVLVVLASDHLMMANDAGLYGVDDFRENLWVVFNSPYKGEKIRRASPMDIAPTFISMLGVDIERFGLGVNLISDQPTLLERFGKEELDLMLTSWRTQFWKFWDSRRKEENGVAFVEK